MGKIMISSVRSGERRGRLGSWYGLFTRRAPTIKRWSLDARSGDHTSHLAECRWKS